MSLYPSRASTIVLIVAVSFSVLHVKSTVGGSKSSSGSSGSSASSNVKQIPSYFGVNILLGSIPYPSGIPIVESNTLGSISIYPGSIKPGIVVVKVPSS